MFLLSNKLLAMHVSTMPMIWRTSLSSPVPAPRRDGPEKQPHPSQ